MQDSDLALDKERSFIVCFYPSDDTIGILEKPLPNSGVPGGKFLRRMRLQKPAAPLLGGGDPQYYGLEDLGLGSIVQAAGRRFRIVKADQFTINYLKRHPDKLAGECPILSHASSEVALAGVLEWGTLTLWGP